MKPKLETIVKRKGDSLERLVRLLDDCDAALTAASANVMHPDLAIACTQRARQCRQMISELKQPNDPSDK